jgi:hypothetical protein
VLDAKGRRGSFLSEATSMSTPTSISTSLLNAATPFVLYAAAISSSAFLRKLSVSHSAVRWSGGQVRRATVEFSEAGTRKTRIDAIPSTERSYYPGIFADTMHANSTLCCRYSVRGTTNH